MKIQSGFMFTSRSTDDTIGFGEMLSKELQYGNVVCLFGDLGAGKTYFVKGILSGLGYDIARVNSPTFTIINEYSTKKIPVFHFDLYRIKSDAELMEIGIEDYFDREGICLIEWPEKLGKHKPIGTIDIKIDKTGTDTRTFTFL